MDFYHSYYRDFLKPPQRRSAGGDQEQPKPKIVKVASSSATDLHRGPTKTEGVTGGDDARTKRAEVGSIEKPVRAEEKLVRVEEKPVRVEEHVAAPARPVKRLVLDIEGLEAVLGEMLASCEEQVQGIRTKNGEFS